MKIVFDASCLAVNRYSGLGEFAHNLLLHMPVLSTEINFTLYINYFRKVADPINISYPRTLNHFLKAPRRLIEFLWRFNWLPFDNYIRDFDIFHSVHIQVPPLKRMKNILTVHDCRYLAFPHIYKSGEVNDYWRQMNRSLNRVDVVVAISEFTRQEILKFFSFPEDRVKVIHYGFNPLRSNGISFDQVKEFIATQEIDPPYLLVPSALDPRKNLDRLIEAFAQCKKENKAFPKMVVAGISNEQWNVSDQALKAKNLDVYDDIIVCGIVDRNIMTALIKNAHALCYPSLYEGFGLPPLEGMSLNVPVLAGKSSSIPEVSGNAACLVDPFDIDDISSGLAKIVSNTEYRQNLVAKGKRQIKHFSWDETATQYLNLYRETMSR